MYARCTVCGTAVCTTSDVTCDLLTVHYLKGLQPHLNGGHHRYSI